MKTMKGLIFAGLLSACSNSSGTGESRAGLTPPPTIVPSVPVGTLAGRFAVSPTGTATFRTPIDVPEGKNGLAPRLAIVYDSRGGNGLLGVGFHIEGLPILTNCPMAGFVPLCLDGQRLVGDLATGMYTAPDSQTLVKSSSSGGVDIYYKSGLIGHAAPLTQGFAVNQLVDRSGNAMNFAWGTVNDPTDLDAFEVWPDTITYAGSASGTRRGVRFLYETGRPDVSRSFAAGHIRVTRRMTGLMTFYVDSTGSEKLIRSYRFAYANDSITARSQLTTIQACDAAGVCLPATNFYWEKGSWTSSVILASLMPRPTLREGDLDGDGHDDLLYKPDPTPAVPTPTWSARIANSTASGFGAPVPLGFLREIGGVFYDRSDGTGAQVVATAWDLTSLQLFKWTGSTLTRQQILTSDTNLFPPHGYWPRAGDIDGDGLPDLIEEYASDSGPRVAEWQHGTSGYVFRTDAAPVDSRDCLPGAVQLARMSRIGFLSAVYYCTAGGHPSDPSYDVGNLDNGPVRLLDVNGDGLDDVVDVSARTIRFNTGGSWAPARSFPTSFTFSLVGSDPAWMQTLHVADVNGDGQQDLSFGTGELLLSTGSSFRLVSFPQVAVTNPTYPTAWMDVDGNNLADPEVYDGTNLKVYKRDNRPPDRITSMRNGLGYIETLHYSSTVDPAVHTGSHLLHVPVVSELDRWNGTTSNAEYFTYMNATSDRSLGFMGFTRIRRFDVARQQYQDTDYELRQGRIGMPAKISRLQLISSSRVRLSTTVSSFHDFHDGWRDFSYPNLETNSEYEWSDAVGVPVPLISSGLDSLSTGHTPLRTTTTTADLDDYANPRSISIAVTGGSTTTIARTFNNDTTNWLIGQLTSEQVTSTTSSGETDSASRSFGHDTLGRLTSITVEPTRPEHYLLSTLALAGDGLVNSITVTPSPGPARVTSFTYDADRVFLQTITNPLGQRSYVSYDPRYGVLASTHDVNYLETDFQYDGFGRPRGELDPDGLSTSLTQAAGGTGVFRTTVTNNRGGQHYVDVDTLGRPQQQGALISTRWSVVTEEYDTAGRLARRSLPHFDGDAALFTSRKYDVMGRLIEIDYADGTTGKRIYDPWRTYFYDAAGHQSYFDLDVDGNLAVSANQLSGRTLKTTYKYGPFGRLEQVTDSAGHILQKIYYDSFGRRTKVIDADAGTETDSYNAFGETTQTTNAMGDTVQLVHDALGRVSSSLNGFGETDYLWDSGLKPDHSPLLGVLGGTRSPDGIETRATFDLSGRLTSNTLVIDGVATAVSTYGYDATGRLTTMGYPASPLGAFGVTLRYASDGRLSDSESPTGSIYDKISKRDAYGRPIIEILGNGVSLTRNYRGDNGRLSEILAKDSAGHGLEDLSFTYWPDGPLATRNDAVTGRNERYAYDELDRLHQWVVTSSSSPEVTTYDYDDLGNLIAANGPDGSFTYSYSGAAPHALSAVNSALLSYDAAGRRVTGNEGGIEYNPFNLPRTIGTSLGDVSFRYDGLQRRVLKSRGSDETLSFGGLFERRRSAGDTTYHYFIPAGRLAAEVVEQGGVRQIRYLHEDQIGTANLITDGSGAIVERRYYSPFGKLETAPPMPGSGFSDSYTGHEGDWEVGFINMRGRIFDPKVGRFLTPDLLVPHPAYGQSFNRYSYVLNCPASGVDPSGFDDFIPAFGGSDEQSDGNPYSHDGEPGSGSAGSGSWVENYNILPPTSPATQIAATGPHSIPQPDAVNPSGDPGSALRAFFTDPTTGWWAQGYGYPDQTGGSSSDNDNTAPAPATTAEHETGGETDVVRPRRVEFSASVMGRLAVARLEPPVPPGGMETPGLVGFGAAQVELVWPDAFVWRPDTAVRILSGPAAAVSAQVPTFGRWEPDLEASLHVAEIEGVAHHFQLNIDAAVALDLRSGGNPVWEFSTAVEAELEVEAFHFTVGGHLGYQPFEGKLELSFQVAQEVATELFGGGR